MKLAPLRSWGFFHPDLDTGGPAPGLALRPNGGILMAEGDAAIRQSLLLLLSTSPGERIMRPKYGCELRRLIFAPNDYTTAGLARHYVRRAIEQWEPRVRLRSIQAEPDPEIADRLLISVAYEVAATRQPDAVALALNLHADSP